MGSTGRVAEVGRFGRGRGREPGGREAREEEWCWGVKTAKQLFF